MRKFLAKFLLLSGSILISLFLLELILRVGLVSNPLYLKRNGNGCSEDKNHYKILFLGDSFIEDRGLKSSLYQMLLSVFRDKPVRVYNTAKAGMGPFDYLNQIEAFSDNMKIDLVVLFYYSGNDLTSVSGDRWLDKTLKGTLKNLVRPILNSSYLFQLLKSKNLLSFYYDVDYESIRSFGVPEKVIELAKKGSVNPWLLEQAMTNPNHFMDNLLIKSDRAKKSWIQNEKIFLKIKKKCEDMESKLLFVTFPTTLQVNSSQVSFFETCGFQLNKEEMLNSSVPQNLINEFCKRHNIEVLDLLPYFRDLKNKELYSLNDDHLNKIGNKVSQELISKFILDQLDYNEN